MNSTRRNVGVLAACQALLFTNNATLIASDSRAGLALAPAAAFAIVWYGMTHPRRRVA